MSAVQSANIAHVVSLLKGRANPDTKDSYGFPVLCHAAFKVLGGAAGGKGEGLKGATGVKIMKIQKGVKEEKMWDM